MVCKTGHDIAETFPVGQLGKGQTEELIETRKALDLVVPAVTPDAFSKFVQRQEGHDLGEDGRLGVHRSLLEVGQKSADYTKSRSNRLRPKSGRILCITCMMEDFSIFSTGHYWFYVSVEVSINEEPYEGNLQVRFCEGHASPYTEFIKTQSLLN